MLSVELLLETVYRYFPRGVAVEDPDYESTPERRRALDVRTRAYEDMDAWLALIDRLREDPVFAGCRFWDRRVPPHLDSCRELRITLFDPNAPGVTNPPTLVGLVSYYLPLHTFYIVAGRAPSPPLPSLANIADDPAAREALWEETDRQRRLDEEHRLRGISFEPAGWEAERAAIWCATVERILGCERLPPEMVEVIVPDVAVESAPAGRATLLDCLFSPSHF